MSNNSIQPKGNKRVSLREINSNPICGVCVLKAIWLSEYIGTLVIAVQTGVTQIGKFVAQPASIAPQLLMFQPAQTEKQLFREWKVMEIALVLFQSMGANTHTTWNIHANHVSSRNFLQYLFSNKPRKLMPRQRIKNIFT